MVARTALRIGAVAACAALISGCGGPPDARREWADGMATLGITPTYPLREDVQLGDIALMVPAACDVPGSGGQTLSIMVGNLDPAAMHAAIRNHYGQRYLLPATPRAGDADGAQTGRAATSGTTPPIGAGQGTAADKAASDAVFRQPTATAATPILPVPGRPRVFDRPRLAAFPGVEYRSFVGGDLSAGAAAGGGLGRLLGLSAENERVLTVRVTNVEEMRVPAGVVADMAETEARSANGVLSARRLALLLPAMRASSHEDCVPVLTFASRVFYARAIEVKAERGSSFAAALSLALQRQATIGRRASIPGGTPAGQAAPGADATQEASLDAAVSALVSGLTNATPGIGASIGISEDGSVALRQAFERPLAFGTDNAVTVTVRSVARLQLGTAAPRTTVWSDSAPFQLVQASPPSRADNSAACELLRRLGIDCTRDSGAGGLLETGPLPPGSTMRRREDGVFGPATSPQRSGSLQMPSAGPPVRQ